MATSVIGFKVCHEQCDQCLFTPDRIVNTARAAEVLRTCERHDSHFVCHKHTIAGRDVCCYGFYHANPLRTNLMRIAARLDMVRFVDWDGNEVRPGVTPTLLPAPGEGRP